MPIVEQAPQESELAPGDILSGVPLYTTTFAAGNWTQTSAPQELCLVLSRPCVIANKQVLTAAAIDRARHSIPREPRSFDSIEAFFTSIRDGHGSPDRFYLGGLPTIEQGQRFFARLDSIHTITVPKESTLDSVLRRFRIARLSGDFLRDLHVRVFTAFASLGFNDYEWYSTQDLQMLIHAGQAELDKEKSALNTARVEAGVRSMQGNPADAKAISQAEARIREIEEKLKPYQAELDRRGNNNSDASATG